MYSLVRREPAVQLEQLEWRKPWLAGVSGGGISAHALLFIFISFSCDRSHVIWNWKSVLCLHLGKGLFALLLLAPLDVGWLDFGFGIYMIAKCGCWIDFQCCFHHRRLSGVHKSVNSNLQLRSEPGQKSSSKTGRVPEVFVRQWLK